MLARMWTKEKAYTLQVEMQTGSHYEEQHNSSKN